MRSECPVWQNLANELLTRIKQLEANERSLRESVEHLQTVRNTEIVAFTVYDLETHSLSRVSVIPFKNVKTNIGNHYNPSTYSFTCPVHGLYVFSVAIITKDYEIGVGIYKNTLTNICLAYAHSSNGDYTMGYNSAVVECNPGDTIKVKRERGLEFLSYVGTHTFSGFLLYKL